MALTPMTRLPTEQEEIMEEGLSETFELLEHNENQESQIRTLLDGKIKKGLFDEFQKNGFITIKNNLVSMEPKGLQIAHNVLRRKRLAERLLKDVLNVQDEHIDPAACQWEHILSKEVTNSICTLLGHPSHSPRDLAIPPGECCQKEITEIEAVISSLDKLKSGEKGKVVYVLMKKDPQLQQLLSLGITPGSVIEVVQRFPTFIIQVNESQLAFDEAIAEAIYVHPM